MSTLIKGGTIINAETTIYGDILIDGEKIQAVSTQFPNEENFDLVDATGTSKAIFRAAMRGILPEAILNRRDKIGFAAPNRAWIPIAPGVLDLLREAGRIPAVNGASISRLVSDIESVKSHPRGPTEVRKDSQLRDSFLVWRLVGLAAWAHHFEVQFT